MNDRILRRIFTFAGLPTFLGFALFPLFYWVKVWVTFHRYHADVTRALHDPRGIFIFVQRCLFGPALVYR